MKNNDLIYDWIDFLAESRSAGRHANLKEIKVRDNVRGRTIKSAEDAGVLDVGYEFIGGKYGDSIRLDPAWVSANIDKNVILVNGEKVAGGFHKKYAEVLKTAFENGCRASGWTPENPSKGFCPKQNGGAIQRLDRSWSALHKPVEQREVADHSWGYSIDFLEAPPNTEEGQKFVEEMKKCGFEWGGEYKSHKDPIHFQIIPGSPTKCGSAEFDGDLFNTLSSAYDYIKSIGSTAYDAIKDVFAESLDRKIFTINDETKSKLYTKYQKYFDGLLHTLQKELKLTEPVKINLLDDRKNGKKVLGKTGSYINHKKEIIIFTTGRHIKDIMRSLSHELVHHRQNIRGEFDKHEKTIHGYAQSNKHLRKMEKEAYLKGNILFRDWEDNYKYRGEK